MVRPQRRWGLLKGASPYPGRVNEKGYNVFFAVDTSGSMSDSDIIDGLCELQGLQKVSPGTVVTVVEFDSQVNHTYELDSHGKISTKVHGRGGTDFDEAFKAAMDKSRQGEVDVIVVVTDGYAPPPAEKYRPPGIPVLWCISKGGVN